MHSWDNETGNGRNIKINLGFKVVDHNFVSIIADFSLPIFIVTFMQIDEHIKNKESKSEPIKYWKALIDELCLNKTLAECDDEWKLDLYQIKHQNVNHVIRKSKRTDRRNVEHGYFW